MQEFQQKFIDEVSEMMTELEHSLLIFEKSPDDKHLIDVIFGDMHTLKGSAGMFGYHSIVELTHKVEDIYAKVQKAEIKVSEKIINLTFSATDLVKRILYDKEMEDNALNKQYIKVIEELNDFFSEGQKHQEAETQQEKEAGLQLFYICFEPDADVEERGINLKKIFQELGKLGQTKIISKPNNEDDKYALSWEIFLATEAEEDDIEEVLMFVDMECEIFIISENNLLLNTAFTKAIEANSKNKELYTEAALKALIEEINRKQKSPQAKPTTVTTKKATLRVDAQKLDDLMKRLSELITIKSELKLTASQKGYKEILEQVEKLEKITARIREDIFDIRLVSLESIRVNIERLIRDTAIALQKEVQFTHEGLGTELDKAIVEKLSAPLMHIVRNSIAHGIEAASIRAERNKTSHGNIKLKAYQSGSYAYIELSDDGNGLDKNKILKKAIENNIVKADEKLSDKEVFELIFKSGLSTAKSVSEISGRGVGMDVVKSEILKLRGSISVSSEAQVGTKITFRLPLSLSILDTLLVQSGNMYFSIPIDEIKSCVHTDTTQASEAGHKYLKVNTELIPYLHLGNIFNLKKEGTDSEIAILVNKDGKTNAIIADRVVGEFQAVVKPLGKAFKNRTFLSGASLLADGNIAYILDIQKLADFYGHLQTSQL